MIKKKAKYPETEKVCEDFIRCRKHLLELTEGEKKFLRSLRFERDGRRPSYQTYELFLSIYRSEESDTEEFAIMNALRFEHFKHPRNPDAKIRLEGAKRINFNDLHKNNIQFTDILISNILVIPGNDIRYFIKQKDDIKYLSFNGSKITFIVNEHWKLKGILFHYKYKKTGSELE